MHDAVHRAQPLVTSDPPCSGEGRDVQGPPWAGRAVASCISSGDRIRVELMGELDLDSGTLLRHELLEALARSAGGLDLDLRRLDFCDCAGLNVLLELRQRARGQAKTVVVQAGSPAVDLLLRHIGARELFAPPRPLGIGPRHPAPAAVPPPKADASSGALSSRSRKDLTGSRRVPRSGAVSARTGDRSRPARS
ncbi:STAS domain-containing protein [Streptomyces naphthomycinicus]|uniref:STAS domain-containing protein n=1 Tax=Streptomyces naphthomycinicus TaxID=2872625 RepID=UPI001CECB0AC|nr:STAS domain-containing protein [Streptomyces sp. TML10]